MDSTNGSTSASTAHRGAPEQLELRPEEVTAVEAEVRRITQAGTVRSERYTALGARARRITAGADSRATAFSDFSTAQLTLLVDLLAKQH